MFQREPLEVTLASAEAALTRAVIALVDVSASWSKTNSKLGSVRLYCRQLRGALVKLEHSDATENLDNARACCRELRAVFLELDPSAKIPFRCLDPSCLLLHSPRTTCWLNYLEDATVVAGRLETSSAGLNRVLPDSPDQAAPGFNVGFPAQERNTTAARASRSLLRQTIDLVVLVIAYLSYFFIDVELQILTLPTIFFWLPG